VRQELRYAKYKVLQIIFPYQKNATASIFINISIWELLHYIGRNSKQEVISMLYCVAFMVLLMQWWNLMEEKEIEGFLKKIWKNFGVIVFIWGNVNIFYWNMSQKILDFMGFYNGESEERYKLIIMSLLVPSVSLLGTMAFYIVFYVFFKIIELLAWVLCRILVKITKKRGFLLVFSIQMVFMAFSMIYEKKWILYPLALFLGVLGTLIKSENHENFPYEISKSCFFISFLYYLMNFGKILLLFEHFQRNDDILLEFLTEDDDFVKYLALVIWCFIGQFLNKMKIERKRMFLFGGLIFLMLFSMITLGIGRVYFINYILTYTAVLVIFLII